MSEQDKVKRYSVLRRGLVEDSVTLLHRDERVSVYRAADYEALEKRLVLMTAERDGLGSQLLDVQQDCVKAQQRITELEAQLDGAMRGAKAVGQKHRREMDAMARRITELKAERNVAETRRGEMARVLENHHSPDVRYFAEQAKRIQELEAEVERQKGFVGEWEEDGACLPEDQSITETVTALRDRLEQAEAEIRRLKVFDPMYDPSMEKK